MNTLLYIAGIQVDLFDDVPIEIDYSLTDVTQPASRKVSHTKTIELPNTNNNSAIFKSLFILGKDNSIQGYDPNIRVPAYLSNSGANVIEGYFQLTGVVRKGNETKWQGVIYSGGKSLFSSMGDYLITANEDAANDVDLNTGANTVTLQSSDYTEAITNAFVASSNTSALVPYDNGENAGQTAYPYYNIPASNLRMCIKFKHIWDRIFAKHGETYSSTFLNSTEFKSMVYMDTHKYANMTPAQYNETYALVRTSSDTTFAGNRVILYDDQVSDAGDCYDPLTGEYTIPSIRKYNLTAKTKAIVRLTIVNNVTFTNQNFSILVSSFSSFLGSTISNVAAAFQNFTLNGSYTAGQTIDFIYNPEKCDLYTTINNYAAIASGVGVTFDQRINVSGSGNPNVSTSVQVLADSSWKVEPNNNSIGIGDTYFPSSVIAAQHKQRDFISDVLKMFNMYLLFDGVNYIIEPRDIFYTLGFTADWTMKVDRSQDITVVPVGQVNWNKLELKPKVGNDFYATTYNENYKEAYGQQNVLNINEFVTETKSIELTFCAPMLVSTQANYPKIQHIYTVKSGGTEPIDGTPRYGYWSGWKENGTVSYKIDYISSQVNYVGYPLVGEWDDVSNPSISVLFGNPKVINYQTTGNVALTTNNLYKYYENELLNQVSANAKLVTCKVYLTPFEINTTNLYDKVIIDGGLFLISKISGFNPINIEPTEVELIQYNQ